MCFILVLSRLNFTLIPILIFRFLSGCLLSTWVTCVHSQLLYVVSKTAMCDPLVQNRSKPCALPNQNNQIKIKIIKSKACGFQIKIIIKENRHFSFLLPYFFTHPWYFLKNSLQLLFHGWPTIIILIKYTIFLLH